MILIFQVVAILKKAMTQLISLAKQYGHFTGGSIPIGSDMESISSSHKYIDNAEVSSSDKKNTMATPGVDNVASIPPSGGQQFGITADNNLAARQAAQILGPGDSLVELCHLATQTNIGFDAPIVLDKRM